MSSTPQAARVAARFAKATHYRVDQTRVPKRDTATEMESAQHYGWYQYPVLKLLPVSSIQEVPVREPRRFDRVLAAMQKGEALPPILVSQHGMRYSITDGVHRYNASKIMGYTHIPAILHITVETPELYRPPPKEKPKLREGTFVRFHDPQKHNLSQPWAKIIEYLTPREWRGVKRHMYALVGYPDRTDGPEFIGDFMDDAFDPERPPTAIQKELEPVDF